MRRRDFLASGLSAAAFALGRDVHSRPFRRTLSVDVERTLAVATEHILPGAAAADVGAFIDKMLADWYTPAERDRLLAGLPELDKRGRARAARDFADCAASDQVAVLIVLDDEVTALRASNAAAADDHWFAMLKYLTVYGYCTSEAGARAMGFYQLAGRYDGCAPL